MGFSIEVPAGDPATILSTADQLGQIATNLTSHGEMISGEQAGITGAWKDGNGQAAATEAGNLSGKSKEFAGHASTAANALRTFAGALKTAQDEIGGLQGQLEEARQAATTEAGHNAIINSPTASPADKEYTRQSIDAAHMQPIVDKANAKRAELMQAAQTCRITLEGATPSYDGHLDHLQGSMLDYLAPTISAAAQEEGQQLAGQLKPLVDQGKPIPADLVRRLQQYQDNPYFAQGFLPQFGADRLYRTAYLMKGGVEGYLDLTDNGKILGAFGHLIAAGTGDNSPAPLPQRYIDSLLSPLDSHNADGRDAAWALSQIMEGAGNPPLGRQFLDQVGDKLYPLEKSLSTPDSPVQYLDVMQKRVVPSTTYNGVDPTAWYFTALGKNAPASQDFFDHADRADFYLTGRGTNAGWDYPDNGEALGSALRSATTQIRTGPGAENSAVAAMNIVNSLGKNQGGEWLSQPGHQGILNASGDILVAYAPSINDSFDGTITHRTPGQALFDRTALMNTMRDSFNSEDNYNRVLSAVAADGQHRILTSVDGKETFDGARFAYNNALDTSGRSLGAVYAAGRGAAVVDGASSDDAYRIAGRGTNFVLGHTVGLIPVVGTATNDVMGLAGVTDVLMPTDHAAKTLVAGLNGSDAFANKYDDNLAPTHAQERLQELYDKQPGPHEVPLDQELSQAKDEWLSNTNEWAKVTWSDDNKTLTVPRIHAGN